MKQIKNKRTMNWLPHSSSLFSFLLVSRDALKLIWLDFGSCDRIHWSGLVHSFVPPLLRTAKVHPCPNQTLATLVVVSSAQSTSSKHFLS